MLDIAEPGKVGGQGAPPPETPGSEGASTVERCFHIYLEKDALSRDVDELQDAVIHLARTLIEKQDEIDKKTFQLEQLRRKLFGRSSEKRPRDPSSPTTPESQPGEENATPGSTGTTSEAPAAGNEPVPDAPPSETSPAGPAATPEPTARPKKPKRPGHGRGPSPDLPCEEEIIDLPEEERSCDVCGGYLKECGRISSSHVDRHPETLVLRVTTRVKRACEEPTCPKKPVTPSLPPLPIDKGKAGPGLLAYVIVSKFVDHLPLYRIKKILSREGYAVPESTLGGWCTQIAGRLQILYELLVGEVLASKVIHTDDTPVQVLGAKKGESRQGHIWVYLGDKNHKFVVFEFTPHRRGEAPQKFLRTFRGYLQADAFAGYNALYIGGLIIEVACWAHGRRGVEETLSTNPVAVVLILGKIQKLYAVEDEAKDLDSDARKALRIEKAKPVIEELFLWLDAHEDRILPKSELGKAVQYLKNQRAALERYLEDGDLKIDNNPVENIIRTVAVGRRNWLFLGSVGGGNTAAILYSIVESARLHGLDPLAYLTDVLKRIPTTPREQLRDLLPDRWKPGATVVTTTRES